MDIQHIQLFLEQISTVVKCYDQIATSTGSDFNIFKILGLSANEVRLHSSLLAELLNPLGSHGQGSRFLCAFKSMLLDKMADENGYCEQNRQNLRDFDIAMAKVFVEYGIVVVSDDYMSGGRIDIMLVDSNNRRILIENKIYAGDQKHQMVRYHEYDPDATLLYMNLYGVEPTDDSKGKGTSRVLCCTDFLCLSYAEDIISWLQQCHKESSGFPLLRESVTQYINLLKHMTNQSERINMQNDIKVMIKSNPDTVNIIEACQQALASLVADSGRAIREHLKSIYPKTIKVLPNEVSIQVVFGEDGGLYFAYRAFKGGHNISDTEGAKELRAIMKQIETPQCRFYYKYDNICWFHPAPYSVGKKVADIDRKMLVDFSIHPEKSQAFVERLIAQEDEVTRRFLQKMGG